MSEPPAARIRELIAAGQREAAETLADTSGAATRGGDWEVLAEAYLAAPRDEAAARRCAARALTRKWCAPSLYRHVAWIFARELRDPDAARAALDAASLSFARGHKQGYEWRDLARGYVEALGDPAGLRRCLERATMALSTPADLCEIAEVFAVDLGDVARASALIERAEARIVAGRGTGWRRRNVEHFSQWVAVAAVARGVLADPARADAILERASAHVADASDHVGLAAAGKDPARVREALARGEARAAGVDDWLELASGYRDLAPDPAAVRRCLDAASAVATEDDDRQRVAAGYRHVLGDPALADALAPRGFAPDAILARRGAGWTRWSRDAGALIDALRADLGEDELAALAAGDYGQDAADHRTALDDIVATGLVPNPLRWCPLEVLRLERWTAGSAGGDPVTGAFSCALLCMDEAGPAPTRGNDGNDTSLPGLVACGLALELAAPLACFLAAMLDALEPAGERHDGFAMFTRLALLITAASLDPADARLEPLAAELLAHAATLTPTQPERGAILGLGYSDQRDELWRTLVATHLRAPAPGSALARVVASVATM